MKTIVQHQKKAIFVVPIVSIVAEKVLYFSKV